MLIFKNQKITAGKASLIAGVSLLAMAVLAGYANFGILQRLEAGDDTPYNFSNSIGSVRLAIVCLLVTALLDLVVAAMLYRVFKKTDARLAMLAQVFRIIYAGVFTLAIFQLVRISMMRSGNAYQEYFQSYNEGYITGIQKNIDAFHTIWSAGLVLFGVHLLLVGWLAYRAKFMSNIFAVLLAIAGLGYLIDSLGALYVPGYDANIASVTFIGEVVLIFWLLIKGRRLKASDA